MSVAMWANGMQQNIVFLYDLLKECGFIPLYITAEPPKYGLKKNHIGIVLKDLLDDESEILDILIVSGFDLPTEILKKLKKRNPNLKIILIHYGNKLFDDIHHGISGEDIPQKEPIQTPAYIDEVWTSPHYTFAKPYLENYHNCEVNICPYIWDSYFVKEKIKDLKRSPVFNPKFLNKVCVFEPNKNPTKTCLIPLMTCESFEEKFPEELSSVSIFCSNKIRERDFFVKYVNKLKISKKENYLFFNNRWSKLDAVSRFGNMIVSHQFYNELNYSHLESLYLGLPLIHNSKALMDVGYYYPDFDVNMAANQIKSALTNHESVLNQYKEDSKEIFHKFSIYNKDNINAYKNLLD